MCMDYDYYARALSQVLSLQPQFNQIAEVLTNKLKQFQTQSFGQMYLFGSGFGA